MPLSQDGAQPGRQAAAPMEIAKERLPLAGPLADAVEVRIQGIREIARSPARLDGVGRSIQEGPLFQHEVIPRSVVPSRTGTGESEILQVQSVKVAFEILRSRRA